MRYEFDEVPIDIAGKPVGMFFGEYTLDEGKVDGVWLYSDTGFGPTAKRELIALHEQTDAFSQYLCIMLRRNIVSESRDYPPRPATVEYFRQFTGA